MINNQPTAGGESPVIAQPEAKPVVAETPVTAAPKKSPAPRRASITPKAEGAAPAAPAAKKVTKPAVKPKTVAPAKKTAEMPKPAPAAKTVKKVAAPKAVKEEAKADKKEKEKKEKVVRDSFSMPKSEHGVIKQLRTEIARAGRIVTKSEILRAALKALTAQGPVQVVGLIETLPVVPKGKAKKSS